MNIHIIFILILALIFDLAFGEPRNTWHPVAWMGNLISLGIRQSPKQGKVKQFVFGTVVVIITLTFITSSAYFLLGFLKETNALLSIILSALILKFTFSFRGLREAAISIKKFISRDELSRARFSLRSLVSRDTSSLDKSQIVAATVESVAENSCDSFTAPLFYFIIFGVPGAIAYRIINTFDAMIGYHGDYEYLGKFAAHLDDVANYIPARIAALIIVVSAWISRKSISQAWHIMLRDHSKTQSPNAGWTMSAVAGALGIQLEKTGHYILGNDYHVLSVNTIDASLRIITIAALFWSLFMILLTEVIYYGTA
jgi:adenosylcobinamide-phosphate synthase